MRIYVMNVFRLILASSTSFLWVSFPKQTQFDFSEEMKYEIKIDHLLQIIFKFCENFFLPNPAQKVYVLCHHPSQP